MKGVAVPMMLAAFGVIASIIGTFFVKTKEDASQKNLLKALRLGTYISAVLVVAGAYVIIRSCFRNISGSMRRCCPVLSPVF